MTSGADHLSEFTLHVVLATFPPNQEKDFNISVRNKFFESYWKSCKRYLTNKDEAYGYYNGDKKVPVLYNPIRYHILGNYDIAYITLIDSYKFAQRLFEPQKSEEHNDTIDLFGPHTFQSFTGITHHQADYLKGFFYDRLKKRKPQRKFFLGLCNLKLNNGFLIGNGKKYLISVFKAIDHELSKHASVEYLKLQSFSWFEISLMIFSDDPQQIADIIQTLRRLTLEDLKKWEPKILDDSLYRAMYPKEKDDYFRYANVFADTHTYVGIHGDVFEPGSPYCEELLSKDLKLKTEVEFQIKPGHMHLLAKMLSEDKVLKNYPLSHDDKHFLAGRSDYCLKSELTGINEIVRLIGLIINRQTNIFDHVRKIRTKVFFDGLKHMEHPKKTVILLNEELRPLAENIDNVAMLNEKLRALKLSRQIRSKVLKIFSNYNNGVQDIVLFPYLLDLKIFIERLKGAIDEAYNRFIQRFEPSRLMTEKEREKEKERQKEERLDVDRLEDILMKMIEIFQEGFNIRMLNAYQFEDIYDFDLDFNSSIQQLLSMYSTMAFEIGNLVYKKPYSYGPVIQLNLKDTVSNDSSINYAVNHLTSPEFIFATISKEIINGLPKDDDELDNILKYYGRVKGKLLADNVVINDLDHRGLINLSYFLNDAFRYVWTYKTDFKLFYYWFWTYNFQNASLYSETGLLDESHFEKELFRILFIAKFYGTNHTADVVCPLQELETYWDRHFEKINLAVADFLQFLEDEKITARFLENMERTFDIIMKRGEADYKQIPMDDGGTSFRAEIESGHHELNLGNDYLYRLCRRSYVFKYKDEPPKELKDDTTLYLEWYMWSYLNKIYHINKGKISLVRRDWKTGKPMVSFVKINEMPSLYSVDQIGGLFFEDVAQQNAYFKQSTEVLTDLWDFTLKRKKTFIIKKLSSTSK